MCLGLARGPCVLPLHFPVFHKAMQLHSLQSPPFKCFLSSAALSPLPVMSGKACYMIMQACCTPGDLLPLHGMVRDGCACHQPPQRFPQ